MLGSWLNTAADTLPYWNKYVVMMLIVLAVACVWYFLTSIEDD